MMPYQVITGFCRTAPLTLACRIAIDVNLRKWQSCSDDPALGFEPFRKLSHEGSDIHSWTIEFICDRKHVLAVIVLPYNAVVAWIDIEIQAERQRHVCP